MRSFNLSEWALEHQSLVLFFMLALFAAGLFSYFRLGQAEDPEFTFKVMVVRAIWPGASPAEMEQQVTERLEKKLQETPYLDYARSYSKPGETSIFVTLKDSTPPKEVPGVWYQVRKKIGDIRSTLPAGTQGPFFNDEFGDTFGNIYAFTGDGFPLPSCATMSRTCARKSCASRTWPRPRSSATRTRRSTSRCRTASSPRSASTRCRSSTCCANRMR